MGLTTTVLSVIAFTAAAPPECNANGRADAGDIAMGDSSDANRDGLADGCESAEIDGDGDPTGPPLLLAAFGACSGGSVSLAAADFNSDGCIGLGDLAFLLATFGE